MKKIQKYLWNICSFVKQGAVLVPLSASRGFFH